MCKGHVEIRVDNRIKTNVKIQCNKPDLFIHDKRKNLITLIEVGITSQDNLQTKKLRNYDLLANELILLIQGRDNSVCFNLGWCNNKISQYVR
ncbi:hypothetical protein NUSPORA_02596 [Nucleospora cyclopteri]